jgi:hypothetical protein
VLLFMSACIAMGALLPGAAAGDRDLATFLLQHGKEALQKGDPAGALAKLEKARAEDPDLVEVDYWLGAVREARNDTPGALTEYRAFLKRVEGAGTPSKELLALQKKAQARLLALDAARIEVMKAHDAFGNQVVELARRNREANPELALRALRLLMAVHPEHTAGASLLQELGGTDPKAGTPLAGLADEWDLIAARGLGTNTGWTYGEGRIDLRVGKGALITSPTDYDSGPTYACEAQIERGEPVEPGRTSVFGLTFGWADKSGFGVVLVGPRMLIETFGLRGHSALAQCDLPEWLVGERRTVTARIDGVTITAYLDGKKLLEAKAQGRTHLAGNIGVVNENWCGTLHRFVIARPAQGGK